MNFFILLATLSSSAFADDLRPPPPNFPPPPPPPGYGCQIIYPGQSDRGNRHCINEGSFGVTYDGYFFSDSPCFSDYNSAMQAIQNEPSCNQGSRYGYCSLLAPGLTDANNHHCVNESAWSVTYYGSFFSDSPCFSSVGEAARSMQSTWTCQAPPQMGRCSLVAPGQNDRNNRHCVDESAWAVSIDGYFISDSPCHSSVDEALRDMQQNPACR